MSTELRQKLKDEFLRTCKTSGGQKHVSCANFISLLYSSEVVDARNWPAPRIMDEMYTRGYHNVLTLKPSYGVEKPPMMTFEDCVNWVGMFRLLEIKRLGQ